MNAESPWQEESGVRILRLYKAEVSADWPKKVEKGDLCPDWPRIVILDLDADQFKEFEHNPLAFTWKYKLYPEQPLRWISHCAKPPLGEGIPKATEDSRWIVILLHGKPSGGTCCACPISTA